MKSRRIHITSKKCPVQHKSMFPTQDIASRAMMRAWGHDSSMDILDMHTYVCPDCGHWHFGHISYFKQVQERQNV